MNEGMFICLRGLGQETNSLLMQLLAEQKRTNEMLSQLATEQTVFYPTLKVQHDMGNIGPIDAATGEPVRAKPAAKKGK